MLDIPASPIPAGGIADYAQRLRSGKVSAETAAVAYLERITALDDKLDAFVEVDADRAIAAAQGIDRLLTAGVDLGPLMGVPVAVKDLFAVDGMPTRAGSHIDVGDCIGGEGGFVRALKQAGCVILGKTRTIEFAAGALNLRNTMPRNPWDGAAHRSPGGSSHGSAVAAAAQLCAFAIGSDTGGSVRQPAAFNGLCGLKPSHGLWPLDGVFPLCPDMDTIGLLCCSMGDLRILAGALGIPRFRPLDTLSGLRFATSYPGGLLPSAEIRSRFEQALARIQAAGAEIMWIDWPDTHEMAEIQRVFAELVAADLLATLGTDRFNAGRDLLDPVVVRRLHTAVDLRAVDYVSLQRRRRALAAMADERLSLFDALLTPTTPDLPPKLTDVDTPEAAEDHICRILHFTRLTNVHDQCAVSIPMDAGHSALPAGLQVTSRKGDDARLIELGAAVEAVLMEGNAPTMPDLGWAGA